MQLLEMHSTCENHYFILSFYAMPFSFSFIYSEMIQQNVRVIGTQAKKIAVGINGEVKYNQKFNNDDSIR